MLSGKIVLAQNAYLSRFSYVPLDAEVWMT